MINDMLKPFKEAVSIDKNIVLDNYRLKDGIYILLNVDKPIEINENNCIIINNKRKEDEAVEIKKPELYKLFKEMDYSSVILNDDTNKCIDLPAKKIHSTNWMTLFIKKDICPVIGKNPIAKIQLLKLIETYFDKLIQAEEKFLEIYDNSNYKKGKLKGNKKEEFLQEYFGKQIKYIRSEMRTKGIERNKKFILDNFDKIIESLEKFNNNHYFNGYVKIFIDESIEIYRLENEVYTIPRIFNVNDYNLFIDGQIYGLPSNNITTNSKKPYLLLRAMQCNAPYRAKTQDVEFTKNFFEWLGTQGKFKEIKLDYNYNFDGTELHKKDASYFTVHLNQNSEIDDYDSIPFDKPRLNFTLYNVLGIKERINKDDKNSPRVVVQNEFINNYAVLQQKFCEYFFNSRMQEYFKDSDPDVKSNEFTGQMKALFMLSRDALYDFFSRGIDISIKNMINKLTMDLLLERLKKTAQGFNLERIARAYNLRLSLLIYFELGGMDVADRIKSLVDNLKNKLDSQSLVICESDEEFYFTAGQLAYYILSQSESDKKTFGLFEPILNAKNSAQLKRKLSEIFAAYKHAISTGNIKFKNAMGMVMGYEPDRKITDNIQDILLAGILANNIFYEKKED